MAIIYVDALDGSDSNGGGAPGAGNAKQTLPGAHAIAAVGDTILLKRGQSHVLNQAFGYSPRAGTVKGAPWSTIGAYGEAQIPYAILDNIHASGPTININGGASARFSQRIQDLWVKCSGHVSNSVLCHSNAGNLEDVEVLRCLLTENRGSSALGIRADNVNTLTTRGVVVQDCEFYGNGNHCILTTGQTDGVIIRRNKVHDSGFSTGSHGISSFGDRVDTTGWTVASGVIYQKTGLTYRDVYYVSVTAGAYLATYPRLVKNTATPTTPGAGEFGYVPATTPGTSTDGVLYINLGAAPSGTINVCYGRTTGLVIEDNEIWGIAANLGYTWHEGAGIQLDDYTENSFVRRNRCRDNEGAGIVVNWGSGNTITGNECFDNGWPGMILTRAPNVRAYNNVLARNNRLASHGPFTNPYDGELILQQKSTGADLRNNIILSTRAYGIVGDTLSTVTTNDRNYVEAMSGRLSGVGVAAETNSVTVRPAFVAEASGGFMLAEGDAAETAGAWVASAHCRNGGPYPGRVPVGAWRGRPSRAQRP